MTGVLITQFDLDQALDLEAFRRAFVARFDGGRVDLIADEVYPGHRRLHLVTLTADRAALFPWLDEYARTHDAINRQKPGDGFPFNPNA